MSEGGCIGVWCFLSPGSGGGRDDGILRWVVYACGVWVGLGLGCRDGTMGGGLVGSGGVGMGLAVWRSGEADGFGVWALIPGEDIEVLCNMENVVVDTVWRLVVGRGEMFTEWYVPFPLSKSDDRVACGSHCFLATRAYSPDMLPCAILPYPDGEIKSRTVGGDMRQSRLSTDSVGDDQKDLRPLR